MSVYRGRYDEDLDKCIINVESSNGSKVDLNLRLDLRNHSPNGFSWGYPGSGPSQTALAILAHHLGDDETALTLYMPFKWHYLATLDADESWALTSEEIDGILIKISESTDAPPDPHQTSCKKLDS